MHTVAIVLATLLVIFGGAALLGGLVSVVSSAWSH